MIAGESDAEVVMWCGVVVRGGKGKERKFVGCR